MELTLEQDLQKLIRGLRRDAVYDRWDNLTVIADIRESIAMDLERTLNKHNSCVPVVAGYPRGMGWNVTSPWRYVFTHHSSW